MLKICEAFAAESNIRFSTNPDPKKSKIKAIYVFGKRATSPKKPAPAPADLVREGTALGEEGRPLGGRP